MQTRQETSNKSGKLFERHKSVAGEVIQSNRLRPTVFTVKSSSNIEPLHRIKSNIFYDNLKPFILVMRAMGVSPVRVTSKGNDLYRHPRKCENGNLLGYNSM
jgi:hypothetical protein